MIGLQSHKMTCRYFLFLLLLLTGCAGTNWHVPAEFTPKTIHAGNFEIATLQKITSPSEPIHIYIEGDGHAFDGRGVPTRDPTPRGTFLRELAASDTSANVVYMARPCQYIMSPACDVSDWTDGRFSSQIIESTASAIKQTAAARPIILIGYSGGALLSGLIIEKYPELNVKKWITIAGVLNHSDWTEYFGDSPLIHSMNLDTLPRVHQLHYAAENDKTVPNSLTMQWTGGADTIIVPNATHDDFENLILDFTY